MSLETILLGGRTTPRRSSDRPEPATVVRVTAAGELYVELDGLPDVEVGPVRWSRPQPLHVHPVGTGTTGDATYAPLNPPAGTGCLVLFAGDEELADGWLVAWDGWPA